MAKPVMLTAEGLKQLEEELDLLKGEKRKEIAEKIKVARSYGDLSENSEYDDAKNEQAMLEARIVTIEATLKNAVIIAKYIVTRVHDRTTAGYRHIKVLWSTAAVSGRRSNCHATRKLRGSHLLDDTGISCISIDDQPVQFVILKEVHDVLTTNVCC